MKNTKAISLALIILLSTVAFAAPASAAGSTDISLNPAEETTEVGQTTTFDIVVENAQGGVGAFSGSVALENTNAANIVDAEVLGNPDFLNISGDGDEISMVAAGMNTGDTGSVTVARVTIKGVNGGDTGVNLKMNALGDEAGESYTITGVSDSLLHVSGESVSSSVSLSPQSQTVESGETTRFDVVVNDADGGVGAFEATMSLSNGGAADFQGVEFGGQAEFFDHRLTDNGDTIVFQAAGMDTANIGDVTIAQVEVAGTNAGSSAVGLDIEALGNEDATRYQVTEVAGGSLTVEDGGVGGGDEVSIYLDGAPDGLRQYSINVSSDDGKTITELSPELIAGDQFQKAGVGTSEINARGVDLAGGIGSFNDQRTLFKVAFDGPVNKDNVSVTVVELVNDNDNEMDHARVGLSVRGANPFNGNPIPGVGANPPMDPDGDGLFEDANGDGEVSFEDAVALAFANAGDLTPEQEAALDFNGDGQFTFDDAVTLAFNV